VNIEQLRAALERMKKHEPKSEGLSCERIASTLGIGRNRCSKLIGAALADGTLERSTYYITSNTGVVRPFIGFKLATKKTGTKKTRRS